MEDKGNMSVEKEAKSFIPFYRKSPITEILKLVFNQCVAEKEIKSIILSFDNKFGGYVLHEDDYSEFVVMWIDLLDYVYKRNGPSVCAVSRSLYCYLKLTIISREYRGAIIDGRDNTFLNILREFTNLSSAEGEDILADALLKSLLDGNLGLSLFLLKFGVVEFPSEVSEKNKKIVKRLVDRFNNSIRHIFVNDPAEGTRKSIQLDELLDLMRQSDINFKRSLMAFFAIISISEYRLNEQIEMVPNLHYIKINMKNMFNKNLVCLGLIFSATTEAKLASSDIETFIAKFLNPLLNVDFGKSLIEFSRKTLGETFDSLDPRSLKDLARSAIRSNLKKSMTLPEQVDRFNIPVALKRFLLYHCEEIFDMLKESLQDNILRLEIKIALFESLVRNLRDDLEN